jgi:hypothetical protein
MRAPPFASLACGPRLASALVAAALSACTATTDAPGETSAAPEVQALFGSLKPASPDRLRGVWSITTSNTSGDAELRMRFEDGALTVGTRCTTRSAPTTPVLVGTSGAITTTDLDGKTGVFDLAETLAVTESRGGLTCSGRFDKATWQFAVAGTSLTMDPVGQQGQVHLEKVGD